MLGDETLKTIAHKLAEPVRSSATIGWNHKESVRAKMCTQVRRLLARYDYPSDQEENALELVLRQAEIYVGEEAA